MLLSNATLTRSQEVNDQGLLVFKSTGWNKFEAQYPDEPKYSISGSDSQVLTVQLEGRGTVYSEPGTMVSCGNWRGRWWGGDCETLG